MNKVHYASCDRANESHNQEYWSNSICGLEYFDSATENIAYVTCKRCLRKVASKLPNKAYIQPYQPNR